MTSTVHFIKKIIGPDGWIIRVTKMTNDGPFLLNGSSKILFFTDTLSVGGCWGQPMLLFWKFVDETQMDNPRDHAARDIVSSEFSIFLPLRAIYFR